MLRLQYEKKIVIEEKKYLTKPEVINILKTINDLKKRLHCAINIDERKIEDVNSDKT